MRRTSGPSKSGWLGPAKDFVFFHRKFRSTNFEPEPQISTKFRCSRHKPRPQISGNFDTPLSIWVVIVRWSVPMPKTGRNQAKLRFCYCYSNASRGSAAADCVTAYGTLKNERTFRLGPQISMKFRRAPRPRKFRNEFREILGWGNRGAVKKRRV